MGRIGGVSPQSFVCDFRAKIQVTTRTLIQIRTHAQKFFLKNDFSTKYDRVNDGGESTDRRHKVSPFLFSEPSNPLEIEDAFSQPIHLPGLFQGSRSLHQRRHDAFAHRQSHPRRAPLPQARPPRRAPALQALRADPRGIHLSEGRQRLGTAGSSALQAVDAAVVDAVGLAGQFQPPNHADGVL